MADFLSPEIIIRERATLAVADRLSSSTTGAMIATATKGPVNRPQLVRSTEDYFAIYGQDDGGDGLESAVGYFLNGGTDLLINRITGAGAQQAGLKFFGQTPVPTPASKTSGLSETFDLSPAALGASPATLIASIDGAGASTATVSATQSTLTAAGAPGGAGTNGDTLVFTVNGITQTYTVPIAVPTTAAEWALSIQAQIPDVIGNVLGGVITLTTERYGSTADVDYVSATGTAGADSGFGAGPTAGVNPGPNLVADLSKTTAAEIAAILQADWTGGGGVTAVDSGGQVVVSTVATGLASTIGPVTGTAAAALAFPAGTATGADAGGPGTVLGEILATSPGAWGSALRYSCTHRDRIVANYTDDFPGPLGTEDVLNVTSTAQMRPGLTILIEDPVTGAAQRTVISAITGPTQILVSPGITASLGFNAVNNPTITKETFDFQTQEVSANGQITTLRTFEDVSMQITDTGFYFPDLIGTDPTRMDPRDSIYLDNIIVPTVGPNSLEPLIQDSRPSTDAQLLASGREPLLENGNDGSAPTDVDYIGDSALKTGLYAYDKFNNFAMLIVPGVETVDVHKAMMDYAELRQDFVAFLDSPAAFDSSPSQVVTYKNVTANLFGTFGYMSTPHVTIRRKSTQVVEDFPQAGFVIGAFARTDRVRNVSKPAAGVSDGQLRGILGVAADNPYNEKSARDTIYPEGINPIVAKEGRGICIFGQQTLNPQSDRGAIGVRRAFIQIRKDLETISEFVLFEQNTTILRADYRKRVKAYLTNQRKNGVLQGSTDAESYYVICDETNNPPTVVNARRFVARIGLNVLPGVDFVEVEIERDTRALDAELGF